MNKCKKIIFIIFGIITFALCIFLGLGYLGQKTGGESLIQVKEKNNKYEPKDITKYYPPENLNSKENLLSDNNYANSIQDALLRTNIEFEEDEKYLMHISKVIKEFENEKYKSVLYISEKMILSLAWCFRNLKLRKLMVKRPTLISQAYMML